MIQIRKRNGTLESLDINKFHKVAQHACDGLAGVSVSDLELKTQIQFFDRMTSEEIQEILIKAAADLISEDAPNYQYVAGRLINYHLRKEVYGSFTPPHLKDHIRSVVADGYYDSAILDQYTDDELDTLNGYIDHRRDDKLAYAAMEQFRGKYLVKNRVTQRYYETPQMAFMLIAMCLFSSYTKDRLKWVRDLYDSISLFDISLPTPIMAGVRTSQRQFSSCVLIDSADSLDSINATTSSIVRYVSQKAGIGVNVGRIRALGSPIRKGDASHTGIIPFMKLFQAAVKSCSQGGVRSGAATFYYPIWHLEVEDLLVLKNNKGTEENRMRHVDYGVQFNRLMYERLIRGENITLFSPNDVPGMYEAFFTNYTEFFRLYTMAENTPEIRKKAVPAIDLFNSFLTERKDTGRIYLMNVDNVNIQGSFDENVAPVFQSNLCCEITLPTKPLNDLQDSSGEIALCTLAAINWGKINKPEDFEKPCTLAVRALDALLDYQRYPVIAAQAATENRRPLGIGIINFAYWLAKNDSSYSNPDLNLIHRYAEAWSYYLINASADLAEEYGPCPLSNETKYDRGILPIDLYSSNVDELVKPEYKMPWYKLTEKLEKHGIRNSTLMAIMPSETSSQISNATNGIEPPRSLVSVKVSKDGVLKQVVPSIHKLKNKYELLWDIKSPEGYLKICAVLQKFVDQAISVNTTYNPEHFPDGKIPMSMMMQHMLQFYRYGGKNLYYFNTYDSAGEIDVDLPPMLDFKDEEDCDSCKL